MLIVTIILLLIGLFFSYFALVCMMYELFSDGTDFIADLYYALPWT